MQYAQAYCAQAGLSAKYVRTFYPRIQNQQRNSTVEPDYPDDPGRAGRYLEQAGENLQGMADSLDAMPTSHYKCVKPE